MVGRVAEAAGLAVLRQGRQRGYCVAVNAGVRAVSGDVVEILNDDTEVSPGWSEAALARFKEARIAAVTPLVLQGPPGREDPPRVDSTGDEYWPWGVARKRGHGEVLGGKHLNGGWVFGASGSSSFFRRDVFLSVGGLPEEFGAYFDDVDLSWRLRRAGYRVWYEPGSRVYHRVSSSHGPPRGELLAQQSRNEEMVYWRNVSGCRLLLTLPGHAAVLVGKTWRRWREGQLRAWLRGRIQAWQHLSAPARAGSIVQCGRD